MLGREGSSGLVNGLGRLQTPRVKTSPLDPNAQPTPESEIGV